jgi:hydrogenase maturation factor
MKIGKVSEPILKRSVLKYLKPNNEYMKKGATIGADCALFSMENRLLATATASVSGEKGNLVISHAIMRAANNLAAGGAIPFAVQLHIMLPERYREIALKRMMEEAAKTAERLQITISGGHTETLPDIQTAIVSATALGYQDSNVKELKVSCGQDIVMSKWIGISETARLAREKEEELLTRYPAFFIKSAQNLEQYYSILPEAATAIKSGVSVMHDVAGGGIFGALWELGEKAGVGLQVYLKKIPIKQETVEICEFLGYNPYEMRSDGAMLFVTENGHTLVEALWQQGIEAEVIGTITGDNDKVIINEEEKRFLEPPRK